MVDRDLLNNLRRRLLCCWWRRRREAICCGVVADGTTSRRRWWDDHLWLLRFVEGIGYRWLQPVYVADFEVLLLVASTAQ